MLLIFARNIYVDRRNNYNFRFSGVYNQKQLWNNITEYNVLKLIFFDYKKGYYITISILLF